MKRILPWALITLAVIFVYHKMMVDDIQFEMSDRITKINPVTNIVKIGYYGSSPLIVVAGESMLATKARAQFDIYAMILPYKIIIK